MRKLFLFIFIFGAFFSAYSQQRKVVQFSGSITNDKIEPVAFVNILVANRGKGTISDFWGQFSFPVYVNDSIIFSAVGYKKMMVIVPDTINDEHFIAHIVMQTDTITLTEAVVRPWYTYDQFGKALVTMDVPYDDLRRAQENMKIIVAQAYNPNYAMTGSMNYRYAMQQHADRIYWAGQIPPQNIFNPLAWLRYFDYLKKIKEKDD